MSASARGLTGLALAVVLGAESGCSVDVGRLAAAATRPLAASALVSQGRRQGRSCRWWVLGVPFGLPRLEEAVDAALVPVAGHLMRDVVVLSEHDFYGPVGRHCYTVKGEVLA